MPAVPAWAAPYQFDLTNPYNGTLSFNVATADGGIYLLNQQQCSFDIVVRSTTSNVPQADGSILHHRFLTGVQMKLVFELWEAGGDPPENPACDDLLAIMLDDAAGAFRSLLNAGDNEGRLAWEVAGKNERMLDDVRLLVYPAAVAGPVLTVVTVTIDSQYPYAQDLTQTETDIADGGTAVLDNTGTAEYWPVYQVSNAAVGFTLENETTGESIEYVGTISGADYAELDSFRNTIFLNGNGADLLSNVVIEDSLFPKLIPGANTIRISGGDVAVLWAPAWG